MSKVKTLTKSKLDLRGMSDVDVDSVLLQVQNKTQIELRNVVTDITLERAIDKASTVTVSLVDSKRTLLNSGIWTSKIDIKVDGLWFRLVQIKKTGEKINLVFEDREISLLRTYKKKKTAYRGKATRAEFILNLIKEVKEVKIPHYIPDLHLFQNIAPAEAGSTSRSSTDTTDYGVPSAKNLTVKGDKISKEQIKVANAVLNTGVLMKARRKLLVCSIMTCIQEASLTNPSGGDLDSVGAFQQRASWGSFKDRHTPAVAARFFFKQAIAYDKKYPNLTNWRVCADIQRPREDLRELYDKWLDEANAIVTAFGIPGGSTNVDNPHKRVRLGIAQEMNKWTYSDDEKKKKQSGDDSYASPDSIDYVFYRGVPPTKADGRWKKEDSWTCIQRLANEVNWRAFFVAGTFYLITEQKLFKSKPIVTVSETSDGVDNIDFDFDVGKPVSTGSISCRCNRWVAPPGSMIYIEDMGPASGRWLVSSFERSLFSKNATVSLKKPQPTLLEPAEQTADLGNTDKAASGSSSTKSETSPIPILPTKLTSSSEFSMVDADGAPDRSGIKHHAAKDWFAPAGTAFKAPLDGKIVEIRTPAQVGSGSQVFGGVVKLQTNSGHVWVFRHCNPMLVYRIGARIRQGDKLGTVFNGPTAAHIHLEIWKKLSGGYHYENMLDPVVVYGRNSGSVFN